MRLAAELGERARGRKHNAARRLLLERELRRILVEAQADGAQLALQNRLVVLLLRTERAPAVSRSRTAHSNTTHLLAQRVEHDDDEVGRLGDCDDLAAAALAVRRALDNARQVEQLRVDMRD